MNIIIIKVNHMKDFLWFIVNLVDNNEPNIRVFASHENSEWFVGNTAYNTKIKFTFVICSHIYHVVYSGTTDNYDYENMFNELKDCQTDCKKNHNYAFEIQTFDKIQVDKNFTYITVEK